MTRCVSFALSIAGVPIEDYLTGKAHHRAQDRKPGRSRITSSLTFDEMAAMAHFGIPTEAAWLALPRDERARKVAFLMAQNFISSVQTYEASKPK